MTQSSHLATMSAGVTALQLQTSLEVASDCDSAGVRSPGLRHPGLKSVARCIHCLHLVFLLCNAAQSSDESSVFQLGFIRLGLLGLDKGRDDGDTFVGTKFAAVQMVGDAERFEVELPAARTAIFDSPPLQFILLCSESVLRTTREERRWSPPRASAFSCASMFSRDSRPWSRVASS